MTVTMSTGMSSPNPAGANAWHGTPAAGAAYRAHGARQARVFVLHHYPAFRLGVVSVLEEEPQLRCVGWADSLAEALHTAPAAQPDLLLADAPNDVQALATAQQLHRALPHARLLLLGNGRPTRAWDAGLPPGVCHPLARSVSAAELVVALKLAHAGVAQPARPTGQTATGQDPDAIGADLTQRERSLLTLMARGLSNRDISCELGIAMPTVKFHVTNILSKLQVGNRTSAVLVALRHQLVAVS